MNTGNGVPAQQLAAVKSVVDAATPNNAAGTLAKRDGNGDLAARRVTAALIGNADTATAIAGNKNANLVNAGPASGSAAAATYRALVDADMPPFLIGGGLVRLTGAKPINAFSSNMSANTNTLTYTCPANKRAIVNWFAYSSPTNGTAQFQALFYDGTSYFPFHAATSAVGTGGTFSAADGTSATNCIPLIILDAGEGIGATSTVAAANVWYEIIEFDATVPLRSKKVFNFVSATAKTVYTAGSGGDGAAGTTSAILYRENMGGAVPRQAINVINNSAGGSRTWTVNIVPFGGTPGTGNQQWLASGNATVRPPTNTGGCLGNGDFVSITVDTATSCWAWVNVIEK